MNEEQFEKKIREPNGIHEVLREMNQEINRLIGFARNVNQYGGKKVNKKLVAEMMRD